VDFPVSVRNVGSYAAHSVLVWLASDTGLAPADAMAVTAVHEIDALIPNDPPTEFTLTQPEPFRGGKMPRPGLIVARWTDGNGEHTDTIGTLTIFV
jgi:hypothetical protein